VENDGYQAVQVGFGDVKVSRVNKPMKGHFDKADVAPKKTLKEFRLDSIDGIEVGNILKADTFEVGEIVDVKGTSKGHGTAGAIKRWNFSRLRMTHGTVLTTVTQVHSVLVQALQEYSRVRRWQVTTVTKQ